MLRKILRLPIVAKQPHFFKIHSRIGMKNIPFKGTSLNIGVEEGADFVLSPEFLSLLSPNPLSIDEFSFSNPEALEAQIFNQELARELTALERLIRAKLKPDQMQFSIGGDHALSFSTINALLNRVEDPTKIGYVQFDTHPDMLKESESTTKNFHGMYLRPLIKTRLGIDFDIPEINMLVSNQLNPQNMLFIGNLDAEAEEKKFFDSQEIKNLTGEKLQANFNQTKKWIKDWISQFDYLHINFDIDVFDSSIVQATGCPSPRGLLPDQVFPLLEIIATHPNLSVDLVEVNPRKTGVKETIAIAQQVVAIILGKKRVILK